MKTLLTLALLLSSSFASAYTEYVCGASDGARIYDVRGPTKASSLAYATKICTQKGQGACDVSACKVAIVPSQPSPELALIKIIDVTDVPIGKPQHHASAPKPKKPVHHGGGGSHVTGHCAATDKHSDQAYSCGSYTGFGSAVCGNNRGCIWIEPGEAGSCVPAHDNFDWPVCRPYTMFGPGICDHDEKCTWAN